MKIRDMSISYALLATTLVLGGCAPRASSYESRPATETSVIVAGDEDPPMHVEPATAEPSEHPHGGPPGQTGEHPHGGPPGQTGEHPHAEPTAEPAARSQAIEPTAPRAGDGNRGHGNDADGADEENPAPRRRARRR